MTEEDKVRHYAGVGAYKVIEERMHQLDIGYTIWHDHSHHSPGELMRIGTCYTDLAAIELSGSDAMEAWGEDKHPLWPTDTEIPWKPEGNAIENAIKGAAFVMAALDLHNFRLMEGLEL